jgi:hypothetical protein
MHLQDIRDLTEYLDIPLHLQDAKPILKDYLDCLYPEEHWDGLSHLIQTLVDDGLTYLREHNFEGKMNPKATVLHLEMTNKENKRRRQEYDAKRIAFQKRFPKVKPQTWEIRGMTEPEEWEDFLAHPEYQEEEIRKERESKRDVEPKKSEPPLKKEDLAEMIRAIIQDELKSLKKEKHSDESE